MSRREIAFGDFAEVQPQVVLEKGTAYSFVEMSDVEPHTKSVVPGSTRIWKGSGGAKFENEDVIFARITPCLEHGKTAKVCNLTDSRGFGSTEFFVFRGRYGISDPDYIYYLARSPVIRKPAIKSMIGASGRQRAQKTVIENTIIQAPEIQEQQRIASILSAYDDLIENNRRRIQLIEQAARLLYNEWFVRLRFPGHEHVTITDGVPEGWSRVDLNSIIRIEHGYAFKGAFFSEEITPRILLTPGNFKMGGGIKLDKLKYYSTLGPLDEKYILKKDDLLITMTDLSKASDTLGYALLVPHLNGKVFLHNQRLGAVYPKENVPFYRHFLDQLFKDFRYRGFVVGSASGTSVKHTSPKKILSYKPVLPSYEKSILIREFDDKVRFMNEQIHNLLQTNEKLAQARDLLLPRLMNGEVAV